MSLKNLLGLTLCNLIWSVHPIWGKWLLEEFTPVQGAWLRYTSALLGYMIIAFGIKKYSRSKNDSTLKDPAFLLPKSSRDFFLVVLLGFLSFCFSPLIQMTGLSTSLASENAIIIAMEPLMTAFMACVLLRENLSSSDLSAFSLALIGFSFLAGITPQIFDTGISAHLLGNLLILVSLMGEASYTVLARRLTAVYAPLGIFGSSLLTGVFLLTLSICFWKGTSALLPELHHFTWKTWVALIWLGPIGTAGAYLYLMYVLVDLPVLSVTLFLFLQPLAGALWGYLFLGDQLNTLQLIGGGLILGAVLLPNWVRLKKRSTH